MGNILRRVIAFLLGIVFTITSLIGGVVGGAYYAYKYVSPIKSIGLDQDTQEALGDLSDATIEELVDLITRAMSPEDNGEYTFERLAEEYGLDLAKLLDNMGIDTSGVDKTSSDWKALESISILSFLSDPNKILESTKLKALYPLLPSLLGSPLDELLSAEAQSALGEFTLSQLISADEATGELGIIKAIKGLKIGSLLPEVFDSSFDVTTHEYVYDVKQDGSLKDLTFLNLIGNVPLQGIFNIAEGKDAMTELMEGELTSITKTRISDILNMFADVAGEEVAGVISQYTKVFGDTTIADLFRKTEAGTYEFAYDNLLSGLEFGYLAGFDKVDGEWVDKDGNAPTGLLAFIADISLGEVLNNEGDVVGMINAAAGDLSLMTVYETIFQPDEDGRYPLIIERLGTIKVSDILGDGQDAIVDNLKLSLKVALEGTTLRDAVYSFVDESVQKELESVKIVDALLNVKIDSFILDEYTVQDILKIFDEALGELTVGEIAGIEPTDDALKLLMDYKLGNIFDGVIAILDGEKSPTEIVESFIGQYRVGDVFGILAGFEYDESADYWAKNGKYAAMGLFDLLNMPIARFVALFDDSYDFDFMSVVDDIQIADVAYTVLLAVGLDEYLVETAEDGKITYLLGGDFADFAPLSKVILTVTVSDIRNNLTDGAYWLNRLGKISIGDLTAYVINKLLPLEIKLDYSNGKWVVTSDYLAGLIQSVANTTVGGIVDAVKSGDPELIKQKIFDKLGDTNVGDIVYAVLELAGLKGYVQTAATDSGYEMTAEYADFNNLANALFGLSVKDIVANATDVDWWFEKLGNIKVGDPIAYFINKFAPDMTATLEEGKWNVTGTMGAVLTGLFNITVSELRDPDAIQLVRESFGEVTINDIVGSLITDEKIKANGFVAAILGISVNDIIDMAQSETMPDLVCALQEIFEGVTIGMVVDLTGADLSAYNYGLVERILGTEFEFLFGLLISPDVKEEILYEYGDISLGEVVYTALKIAGVENIVEKFEDGESVKYLTVGEYSDFAALSEKLLSVTVEEVLNNLNGEYWADRMGKIALGDLTAYLFNKVLPLEIEFNYSNGKWAITSDYLDELIKNVANTTIGDIVNALKSGDPELIEEKFIAKLGTTNVGDIVYAVLSLAKVTDVMVKDSSDCGYTLTEKYADFNTLAQTVFGILLSDIITNGDDGEYWIEVFGDTTIGDFADYFLTQELKENGFIKAVRDISVNDVLTLVKSESLSDIVYTLQEIFEGVTVNDVTKLFGVTNTNNEALNKLLDTELNFLIGLINTPDIFGELAYEFKDISLSDAFGDLLEGKIDKENAFVKATLSVTFGDIFGICGADNKEEIADIIYNRYIGVYVGDIMSLFFEVDRNQQAVSTIADVLINDLVAAIVNDNVVEYLYKTFGDVTIGDILFTTDKSHEVFGYTVSKVDGKWVAVSESGNLDSLVGDILNVKLKGIYDDVQDLDELEADLIKVSGNVTLGEFGKLVYDNSELQIGVVDKLYALKLADVIKNVFEGSILDYLKEFALDLSVNDLVGFLLTDEVKNNAFMKASLGITGNTVLGLVQSETLADVVYKLQNIFDGVQVLNITELFGLGNTDNVALNKLLDTELNFFFGLIGTNDLVGEISYEFGDITLGDAISKYIEDVVDVDNMLIKSTLSFSVDDVLDMITAQSSQEIVDLIFDKYTDVNVGDIIELFTVIPDTKLTETIVDINLVSVVKAIMDGTVVDFMKTTFKDTTIGDIAYTAFSMANADGIILETANGYELSEAYAELNDFFGTISAIKVVEFAENASDAEYLKGIFGETTVGNVLDIVIPEDVEENKFVKAVRGISVNDVVEMAQVEDVSSLVTKLQTIFDGVQVLNVTELFGLNNTDNDALNKLLDTELNFFFGLIGTNDLVGEISYEFGDITLGDAISKYIEDVVDVDNMLIKSTLSFSVDDVLDMITAQSSQEIVDLIFDKYTDVNVGDIIELFTVIPDTKLTETIVDINLVSVVKAIMDGTVVDFMKTTFKDTTIGDIAYTAFSMANADGIILETANGYELSEAYAELNDFFGTISAIKVVEFAENASDAEYLKNVFGKTTVGNVLDIVIPDDVEENKFVKAVRNVNVNDIVAMATAEDLPTIVNKLEDIFNGLTLNDACTLVYKEEINNEALKKILGTEFNFFFDLMLSTDVLGDFREEFGTLSIKDAIGSYVTVENAFLDATMALNVENVFAMAEATSANDILGEVKKIYEGVTFGNIFELAGISQTSNEALNNLLDTKINTVIDIVLAEDKLGAIADEFKDVTLGAAIKDFLTGKVDTENAFVKALLTFGVATVIDIVKAEDTDALIEIFQGLFKDVTVGDLVGLFYNDVPTDAANTIYAVKLNDIVKAINEDRLFAFLYDTFGDVALGDIVFKSGELYDVGSYQVYKTENGWKAESTTGELSDLLTKVLNVRLGGIYDDVSSQEQLKEDLTTLVGDTTVGDVGTLAFDNEQGIGVIDKLYAIKFADIIEASFNGTILSMLKDFAYGVTIYDLVGFLLGDTLNNNAFVKATLGISAQTVENLANAGVPLYAVADLYSGVVFGDILAICGLTEAPVSCAEPLFEAKLDNLIRAINDGTITEYVIDTVGDLAISNVINDVETLTGATIISDELLNNAFVSAVLGISVETVYDAVTSENSLNAFAEIFVGSTLKDVYEIFAEVPEFDSLKTILSLDIGNLIKDLSAGNTATLEKTLTQAFDELPVGIKAGIITTAALVGVTIYLVNNDLFVKLVKDILGEEATWGSVLGETLGYTHNETTGNYSSKYGVNPLMNMLLNENVATTLTTGYPLFNNIKNYVTIGNLLTAYDQFGDTVANALGMSIVSTTDGYALDGEYKNFTDNLFNLALGDFFTEENALKDGQSIKDLLYDTFKLNTIGDLTGYFIDDEIEKNLFVAAVLGVSLEDIIYLTKVNAVDDIVVKMQDIFEGVEIVNITELFGLGMTSNDALNAVLDTKLGFLFSLITSTDVLSAIRAEYGEITLSAIFAQIIPEDVASNAFMKATLSFSVETLFAILATDNLTDAFAVVKKLYDGVTFGNALELFGATDMKNEALHKLMSVKINSVIDALLAEDKLGSLVGVIGDLSVGDFIAPAEGTDNLFLQETYAIDVQTIYDLITAEDVNERVETLRGIYAKSDFGDVYELFSGMSVTENNGLNKLLDITFVSVIDAIFAENRTEALVNLVGGITVGDFFKTEQTPDKTLINETYAISVKDVYDLIVAEGLSGKVNKIKEIYAKSSIGSIFEMFDIGDKDNEGIAKVFGITFVEIIDVLMADNKLDATFNVIGDLSFGDFFEPAGGTEKTLLKETYSIDLCDIYDFIVAPGISGKVDKFEEVYAESSIGSIVELFTDKSYSENNGLNKLYAIKFTSILDAVMSEDKLQSTLDLIDDITVGDFIEPADGTDNTFLNETYDISVQNVYDLITAEGLSGKANKVKELYPQSSIGDTLGVFDIGDLGNKALNKLYAIKYSSIIDALMSEDKLGESVKLIGTISIGDGLSLAKTYTNSFIVESLSINVQNVYDVIVKDNLNDRLDVIRGIFVESDIESVFEAFGLKLSGNRGLDKILDTKLMKIVDIALSGDVVNEIIKEIGDITVKDFFGSGESSNSNKFLKATYSISIKNVIEVARDFSVNTLFSTLATIYNGVKLVDVLNMFTSASLDGAVKEAFNLELDSLFTAIATSDYSYVKTYLKSVYNATTTLEKVGLAAVVGGMATALYFINNDLLVSLATKAFGEEATWADALGGVLGYTLNDDGNYVNAIGYNSFMDTLLKEKVKATLTKGYPLFNTFKTHVTIGNMLTASTSVANAVTNAIGMNIVATEKGFALDNEFKPFTDNLFNYPISEIMASAKVVIDPSLIKESLYNTFSVNRVGDILAFFVNRQSVVSLVAEFDETASEWQVTGTGASVIARMLNVTFAEVYTMLKNKDYSVVSKVLGDTTLLDVVKAFKPELADNATIAFVLNLAIKDVINCVRGQITIGSLIGDWTIGDIAGDYLPDMIDKDSEFAKVFLGMTLSEVYGMRSGAKSKIMEKFGEFTFGDTLGFFGYNVDDDTDALVKSVLDLKLNIFDGGLNGGLEVIMNTVKGQKLGLILGYTYDEDKGVWYDGSTEVTGIFATLAGKTITEISDPEFFNGLKLGEALGYTEKDGVWYNGDKELDGIVGAMVGHTIKEITNDPTSVIMDIQLGEALGYTKVTDDEGNVTWYNGEVSDANKVTGVFATLASKTIKDISEKPDDIINGIVLGEALGYTKVTDDEGNVTWYNGEVSDANKVTGVFATLASKTIKDISEKPDDIINGIVLGEALGYTKVTDDEGNVTWYNGEVSDANKVTGVFATLASKTIKEISDDPSGIINGVVLGEALGYTKVTDEEGNVTWYNGTTEVTGVIASLVNETIGDIASKSDEIINDVLLGDALGYTKVKNGDGTIDHWLDKDGKKVTGALGNLASKKIGEISKDPNFVNNLTLGEVIDIDSSNKILYALKGTKIGDLSTAINDMEIGTVLGYYKVTDEATGAVTWYTDEECTNKATGITAALSDITIKDLNETTLKNKINTLTLGEVITIDDDSNSILKVLSDKKIGNLSSALNDLYLGEALGYTKVTDEEGNVTWYNGEVKEGNEASGIMAAFVGLKVSELNDNAKLKEKIEDLTLGDVITINENSNSILKALEDTKISGLSGAIDGMKLGKVLGYTYDETNKIWCTDADKQNPAIGITGALSDLTVKELNDETTLKAKINTLKLGEVITIDNNNKILSNLSETPIGEMSDAINNMQLGTVLGCYQDTDGKWYTDAEKQNSATGITGALADLKISELDDATLKTKIEGLKLGEVITIGENSNSILKVLQNTEISKLGTALDDLYLGDALGYTKVTDDTTGEITGWTKDGKEASGIMAAFVGLKVSDLNEITLKKQINTLTLGDVIVIDNSNKILYALRDTKISEMSTGINAMQLGTIMGYTYDENFKAWYKGTTAVTGLSAKLAEMTVQEIGQNGINASDFTVGDVFTQTGDSETNAFIEFIGTQTTLDAIPTTVTNNFKNNLTVGKAIDMGIFGDCLSTDEEKDAMDVYFIKNSQGSITTQEAARTYWTGMQVSKFLGELITAALKSS